MYVVVTAGLTEILFVVCPPGDHEKVPPPIEGEASNVVEEPEQIVALFALTVGCGFTVTTDEVVVEQPP